MQASPYGCQNLALLMAEFLIITKHNSPDAKTMRSHLSVTQYGASGFGRLRCNVSHAAHTIRESGFRRAWGKYGVHTWYLEQAAFELLAKLFPHVFTLRRVWDSIVQILSRLGYDRYQVLHRMGDASDPDLYRMGVADDSILRAMGATDFQQLLRLVAVFVGVRHHHHYYFLGMRRRRGYRDSFLHLVRRYRDRGVRVVHDHCDRRLRNMGVSCLCFLPLLEHHLDHLLHIQCQRRNCVPPYRRNRHDAGTR
jgi:hypothetical protein